MRWSNDKSTRFHALRDQEARGEISPAERVELDALLAEAEAMAKETETLDAKAGELLRIAEELELVRRGRDEAARGECVDMRQALHRLRAGR